MTTASVPSLAGSLASSKPAAVKRKANELGDVSSEAVGRLAKRLKRGDPRETLSSAVSDREQRLGGGKGKSKSRRQKQRRRKKGKKPGLPRPYQPGQDIRTLIVKKRWLDKIAAGEKVSQFA